MVDLPTAEGDIEAGQPHGEATVPQADGEDRPNPAKLLGGPVAVALHSS